METIGRAALPNPSRLIHNWFALLCVCVLPVSAQSPSTSVTPSASTSNSLPAGAHAVITLDGAWRFHTGDDPQWANPEFNDSDWPTVTVGESLTTQGIDTYSGFAWYRMRLQPQVVSQLGGMPGSQPPALLVTGDSVGQIAVYLDGVESGHTRGMADQLAEYQSPPLVVPVSGSGPIEIAIRTWAGPTVTINRGLIGKVELGPRDEIADRLTMAVGRQWNEHAIAAMIVTFLFLCVAILGAALYVNQRNHSEYLWLTLLCLTVAAGGAADAAFGLAAMPLSIYRVFTLFIGRIFMAVTLEFILRFTASPSRRFVRIVQASVLLLPFVYFVHLEFVYEVLSVAAEVTFCLLVCVFLFHAWRRGRREAGVMLLPFFLAATADSADTILDFAANRHWIPEQFASHRFHLGPIEYGTGTVSYLIFLGSLIAVILYRFVRVSEEEQRSAAEIAAARSVQALLIPTHLPSNRNFMLESAYLPVNGVGGISFRSFL